MRLTTVTLSLVFASFLLTAGPAEARKEGSRAERLCERLAESESAFARRLYERLCGGRET